MEIKRIIPFINYLRFALVGLMTNKHCQTKKRIVGENSNNGNNTINDENTPKGFLYLGPNGFEFKKSSRINFPFLLYQSSRTLSIADRLFNGHSSFLLIIPFL